ncbi:MAG: choice-of-anchor D domain-containing protein [Phycisphaerae bacterium]|nr:choice-of-anchor D domain-containing protein [Phycisphaerae bacterium]
MRSHRFSGDSTELEPLEPRTLMSGAIYNAPFHITTTASDAPILAPQSTARFGISDATADSLINMTALRADPALAGLTGAGYSAVILDTGIDRDHSFFGPDANANGIADRIVYSYDFADNDANASDVNGHGSNVSSIVASQNPTYRGMAPGCNIIHLKVFTNAGGGNFSYVERALQWVVSNVSTYNIVSVNMSLGDSGNYNSQRSLYGIGDELAALAGSNVAVVVAAGNDYSRFNTQGVAYPAADPNVLAVGAVYDRNIGSMGYASGAQAYSTAADRITPFSQRTSAFYQVFAPGAPVTGAGPTGGTLTQHGTSQAAPHVAGLVVLAQQLADQVLGRRLSLAEVRSVLRDSATSILDGDDENDNVTNTGQSFRRVDALAMARVIQAMAPATGSEVRVFNGTAELTDNSGTLAFGSTPAGTPVYRTITIRNAGPEDLTLADLAVPAGFSIVSNFASSTVAPGGSTSFRVRFDAGLVGPASGTISFSTNDADEPTFRINATALASSFSRIIDDGAAGFATTGAWSLSTRGYSADSRTTPRGTGAASATWTFTNLDPGQYAVAVSFPAGANLAVDAPFTVSNGVSQLGSTSLSLRVAPNDLAANSANWEYLGAFDVTTSKIVVRLTNAASGAVVADAVRIERIDNLFGGPEISLRTNAGLINSGATSVPFGSTPSGVPITKSFTIRNVGDSNLSLSSSIDLPAGFSLVSAPEVSTIAPGSSATFAVRFNAGAPGAYSGQIVVHSNDADEADFAFNVSATASAVVRTIDDGAAGFSRVGAWSTIASGFAADSLRSNTSGVGSATWNFSSLTPGQYRVLATWRPGIALAQNAPYTIASGTTPVSTVEVDQRSAPTDRTISGLPFKDLGVVSITGSSLRVTLGTVVGAPVSADAIRIERVDNLA